MNIIHFYAEDYYDPKNEDIRCLYWCLRYGKFNQTIDWLNTISVTHTSTSIMPIEKVEHSSLLFVVSPLYFNVDQFNTIVDKIVSLGTDISHKDLYENTFLSHLILCCLDPQQQFRHDAKQYIDIALHFGADLTEHNGIALSKTIAYLHISNVIPFLEHMQTYHNFSQAINFVLCDDDNLIEFNQRQKMELINTWYIDYQKKHFQHICDNIDTTLKIDHTTKKRKI